MFGRLRVLAGLVALAIFPALACAETVTATLDTLTPMVFPTVQLTYNAGANKVQVTGGAGQIGWKNGSANPADSVFTGKFVTYCIDLLQDINFGHTYTYDVANLANGAPKQGAYLNNTFISPMGLARAGDIQRLYDLHFADTATSDVNKTAFQFAIWNLIYDESGVANGPPDASVSSGAGNFYVVNIDSGYSSAIGVANGYLNDVLNSNVAATHNYTIEALLGENGAQDQVFAAPGSTTPPPFHESAAPLPQPIFGGLALLGFCVAMRWKNRRMPSSI